MIQLDIIRKGWIHKLNKMLNDLADALTRRNYISHVVANSNEAKALALELIGDCSTGFGGSVTIDELKLYEALADNRNLVYWHWKSDPNERATITQFAAVTEAYIASANAITKDGIIVNTDGFGNRVSSTIYGHSIVVLIIGKNKIVDDLDAAFKRIKEVVCPKNARRLNLKTPCALTGKCTDCDSPQRMCSVTAILEKAPNAIIEFHVILVDEVLGY